MTPHFWICTLYSVQCTLYSVRHALYTVQCTLCSVYIICIHEIWYRDYIMVSDITFWHLLTLFDPKYQIAMTLLSPIIMYYDLDFYWLWIILTLIYIYPDYWPWLFLLTLNSTDFDFYTTWFFDLGFLWPIFLLTQLW